MNKKIVMSLLFIVLIAVTVGSVAAADNANDVVAVDEAADEVAVSDDVAVLSDTIKPQNNTGDGIKTAVESAKEGDTIDLTDFDSYNVTDKNLNIVANNVIVKGNDTKIYGYGDGTAIFYVTGKNVTFSGLHLIDTNPENNLTYGGKVAGYGIQFANTGENGLVDNCIFEDFNAGVSVRTNYITVQNSQFLGGIATLIINDPTVNKEQGTKSINAMGAKYLTVENCSFIGPVLDSISIAGGSGDAKIINNYFKDNVYAIYFGGASTDGTFIANNVFETCGYFKDESRYYDGLGGYPVISIEKAASGVFIDNNTFIAINNNYLIGAEQGNSAHGYPSSFGNINITNNKVLNATPDVVGRSVTLLHINCRNNVLNPFEDVVVTGNELFEGVRAVVVWSTEWGTENGKNIVLPKADLVPTILSIDSITDGKLVVKLSDANGNVVNNREVTYTINNTNFSAITDKDGLATIEGNLSQGVVIAYVPNAADSKTYKGSSLNATFNIVAPVRFNTTIESEVYNTYAIDWDAAERGNYFNFTLKDADGNPLANKSVYVGFNGVTYNRTTDENGSASLQINLKNAGTYTFAMGFLGDDGYLGAFAVQKIVVAKKTAKITAAAKSYKASATKKYTVKLSTDACSSITGKAIMKSGKTVKLTINGKTYKAKTNSAGKATFTIKLTKKGTYKAKIKFAGDNTYKASSKSVKIKIK